ncbi:MAG: methyl-accepting chemotaxis protein [Methylococcaceae bacterium]
MSRFLGGWSKIGFQRKLRILIQGSLIIILFAAQLWVSSSMEQQVLNDIEERAQSVASSAINGLNTLMIIKSGGYEVISDKAARKLFIQKIGHLDKVKEMRIIRAKAIDDEFPAGLPEEQPIDEMDRRVLSSGKTEINLIRGNNGEELLRTVMPFIAGKNYNGMDCLKCHGVDEGAVLGAASVIIDIKADMDSIKTINYWIWGGQLILQIILFIVIGVISRRLLKQLGGEPTLAIEIANKISNGDLSTNIVVTDGDTTSLISSMKRMSEMIHSMIDDTLMLAKAAMEGDLSTRADVSRHHGDFRKIVAGVNGTLDAVIDPLNMAATYVERISKGDIPPKITDTYHGDFNTLKENLNAVIEAIQQLVEDANLLSNAALAGELGTRADTTKHQGDYCKIVVGVNETLDSIVNPINEVIRVLDALANSDLTQKITTSYLGSFAELCNNVNLSVDNLAQVVSTIKEASNSISIAAKEIFTGNTELSHRTEQQAASLEETSSSMEELSATVNQNAKNAKLANQMVLEASKEALNGGNVVQQVISTMSNINESSRKIVDIIGVIDSIAFQTNILALNAAVEAARAGENGRGFAVVASEVRNLAQRAAAAAREINSLINDSAEKIEDGTSLVNNAGKTMEDIVASVGQVANIMTAIAAASVEQGADIKRVNQAVLKMDTATQQNATLVEQAAAAAESLEDQVQNLSVMIAVFKMDKIHSPVFLPGNHVIEQKQMPLKIDSYPGKAVVPVVKESIAINNPENICNELDNALHKHAEWKVKFRTAINHHEKLDAVTISKDNCCDFGKWIHGDIKNQLAHLNSFKECLSKHTLFHIEAGNVAQTINNEQYDKAHILLNNADSSFVSASSEVGISIMRLKRDVSVLKSISCAKAKSKPIDPIDGWEEF